MSLNINCPRIELSNGYKIPAVGLGTFQGVYTYESVDDLVIKAVSSAIDIGYRMFDTASLYSTEIPLGKAANAKIKDGVVKREDLFITTKLWCTYHAKGSVVKYLKSSLKNLGLEYVDLYLVHWPISMPLGEEAWPTDGDGNTIFNDDEVSLNETWQGMEECVDLGLAKSIGVSNYNKRQLLTTMDGCKIKPAVNQVESHPFFANTKLVEFCHTHNIHIMCYSPMGKPNRPWAKPGDPVVQSDPTLVEIGKKYGKLPGQVALRYQYQRGNSVIPKSSNPERQLQNINIFDFELTSEDMEKIRKLDTNFRMLYLEEKLGKSKEYPFNEEY